MNFFDIPPYALPAEAQYYFNIMVIIIMMPYNTLQEIFGGQQILTYWNTYNINDPRPYIVGLIGLTQEELNEDFQEQTDLIVEMHPHCVVEIDPHMGVTWFAMYNDEEENDPWRMN